MKAALGRGHEVTAFARNPDKLVLDHPKLTRLKGDFHVRESVDSAVRGQDAVIVTASSLKGLRANPNYFSQGTGYAIDAMKTHGVRRLIVLSALGAGDSRKIAGFILDKLVIPWLLKVPFEDHDRQEKLARESDLDWVIVRPTRLTAGPARKRYVAKATLERVPLSISRADVGDVLVAAAESDTWVRKAVQLGG